MTCAVYQHLLSRCGSSTPKKKNKTKTKKKCNSHKRISERDKQPILGNLSLLSPEWPPPVRPSAGAVGHVTPKKGECAKTEGLPYLRIRLLMRAQTIVKLFAMRDFRDSWNLVDF
ncbi:hypothetical protein CEXT_144921 [Caerostris extrusa]|uniref:Uncharacterized protein n=1 Tax=Caerostris extrusa TaxID=172846 RepID=A0AAV4Q2U5_CAEEX|nr:hypothetical protein CEXT_144921 [Caerostris extrusa]